MALTYTNKDEYVEGNKRVTVYDIAADNAYPAGGYTVKPTNVGLTTLISRAEVRNAGGYVVDAIPQSTGTIKLKFQTSNGAAPGALADFTSSGDLSAVTAARAYFHGV